MIGLYEYGWHTGSVILPFLFHTMPDYKILQSVVSGFEFLILIPFYYIVWESPRWLLTHGKFEEATKRLTAAAKAGGKLGDEEIKRRIQSIKLHTQKEVIADCAGNQTVLDAWQVPAIRRLSMILYFSWFTMAFIYHAFTMNVQNLGGDLFTNFVVLAVVDAGCHTALLLVINRFSRKAMLDVSLTIQTVSLACLLATSFNDDLLNYRIIASCFLRGGMGIAFVINYLYTAETFPTAMRQASMGTCSIFSRLGSIISPFIKELTILTHLSVPTALFMLFTITNLILIQFIPETGKIQMPDTIGQKKDHIESRRNSRAISFSVEVVT